MTTVETPSNVVITTSTDRLPGRLPRWGAVLAGTATGLAIHLLLSMLGWALGLATADPITEENPLANMTVKSGIIWTICALVALWSGSWVAGWFGARNKATGCLHGALVWSMATIGILALVGTGMGAAVGGAVSIFGRGMSVLARPAASGVAALAKETTEESTGAINSYVDEILAQGPGRNLNEPRVRREIGAALTGLFGPDRDLTATDARTTATQALVNVGGLSENEANRRVDEWTDSYNRMKARWEATKEQAEIKAREAADKAASAMAKAGAIAFVGFGLGLIVSMDGGKRGALRSINYELDRGAHL